MSSAFPSAGEISAVFSALGDPTRLQVVARLAAEGPLTVSALADGAVISRQAISKHLRVLDEAGIIRGHRDGRSRVWELDPDRLDEARRAVEVISRRWDESLRRLQLLVEADP